jgi:pectin methylesterase-like acyl-CoA thioesterase
MKKRTHLKSACAATTLMISLVSAPPGLAATIRVPSDYSTIQAATDAASSGDTVEIAPGVYAEQILIVGKSLIRLRGFEHFKNVTCWKSRQAFQRSALRQLRGSRVVWR